MEDGEQIDAMTHSHAGWGKWTLTLTKLNSMLLANLDPRKCTTGMFLVIFIYVYIYHNQESGF